MTEELEIDNPPKVEPMRKVIERKTVGTLTNIFCPFCHTAMLEDTDNLRRQSLANGEGGQAGFLIGAMHMLEGRFMFCPLCRFYAFFDIKEYGL